MFLSHLKYLHQMRIQGAMGPCRPCLPKVLFLILHVWNCMERNELFYISPAPKPIPPSQNTGLDPPLSCVANAANSSEAIPFLKLELMWHFSVWFWTLVTPICTKNYLSCFYLSWGNKVSTLFPQVSCFCGVSGFWNTSCNGKFSIIEKGKVAPILPVECWAHH